MAALRDMLNGNQAGKLLDGHVGIIEHATYYDRVYSLCLFVCWYEPTQSSYFLLCSMAQLTLWYFLEGEDIYSSVTLSRDATVDQLRRMIHGQEQITCKASQLELLKVFHSQFQPPFSDGF